MVHKPAGGRQFMPGRRVGQLGLDGRFAALWAPATRRLGASRLPYRLIKSIRRLPKDVQALYRPSWESDHPVAVLLGECGSPCPSAPGPALCRP